jgi:uncharacterized protein YciI
MEFLSYHRDLPDIWRRAVYPMARRMGVDITTGSVHIVDLPDPATARSFAFDEPNHQAGVHRDVLPRRWHNALGRTMWDFPGGRTGGNRQLVLGLGTGQAADLAVPSDRGELIAYGPLLSDDGDTWLGTAALLQTPDPATARAVPTPDRYAAVEVHNWQFGGRPA